jgi:predicted sulfurtransferase
LLVDKWIVDGIGVDKVVPLLDCIVLQAPKMSEDQALDSSKGDDNLNELSNQKRRRLNRTEQKRLSKQRKKQKTSSNGVNASDTSNHINGSSLSNSSQCPPPPPTKPHKDYLSHYVPFPSPETKQGRSLTTSVSSNPKNANDEMEKPKVASVGKWFPKAIQLKRPLSCIQERTKGSREDSAFPKKQAAILLFYQYITPIPWSESQYRRIHDYLLHIGLHRVNVAGRIRISKEGLNVTLSAVDYFAADYESDEDKMERNYDLYCADAVTTLHYFVEDLLRWDETVFTQTDFKYITHLTPDRHFTSFQILPVQELVYYGGLNDQNASIVHNGGKHVSPMEFHQLLAGEDIPKNANDERPTPLDDAATATDPPITQDNSTTAVAPNEKKKKDIVVIDVRNHYEAVIGRFDGQAAAPEDATPDAVSHRPDNTAAAAKYVDPKMRKSTDFPKWVQKNVDDLLQKDRILLYCTGGIRCERASAHLTSVLMSKQPKEAAKVPEIYQLQGGIEKYLQTFPDGGFWRGKNFTFDKREAISAENWNGDGGVLQKAKTPVPPKKEDPSSHTPECVICHVFWDRYLGKKKCCTCGVPILVCEACLSTVTKPKLQQAQCPLCLEERITVPASALAYTQNGIQSKVVVQDADGDAKAATTVLKWGGGHGQKKKPTRVCKFGDQCRRTDCRFQHCILPPSSDP